MQRITLTTSRYTEPGESRPTHVQPAGPEDQPSASGGWQHDLIEVEVPDGWSVGTSGAGERMLWDERDRALVLRLRRDESAVLCYRHRRGEDSRHDVEDQPCMSLPVLSSTAD